MSSKNERRVLLGGEGRLERRAKENLEDPEELRNNQEEERWITSPEGNRRDEKKEEKIVLRDIENPENRRRRPDVLAARERL